MAQADRLGGKAGERATWVGAGANVFLIVAKGLAGSWGNSRALVADAIHSLSDLVTDAIVLAGLRVGSKGPDADHHFGHARIETLASAAVGVSLILVAGFLGYRSARDVYLHVEQHPNWLAVVGAAVSLIVKEALYHYTVRVGRRIRSPAVVANAWHHRSDAFSSVAVLIGVITAQVRPSWFIVDAVAALLVAVLIANVAISVLLDALREMTDRAPPSEVLAQIREKIFEVEGVQGVHDLKVRSSGGLYQVQVRVVVDSALTVVEGHRVAEAVERGLRSRIEEVAEAIVHVDPVGVTQPEQGPGKIQ